MTLLRTFRCTVLLVAGALLLLPGSIVRSDVEAGPLCGSSGRSCVDRGCLAQGGVCVNRSPGPFPQCKCFL